ncbi:hypothetical protein VCSRO76_3482 [Vibrio cholerae]|nr:hypothetical protein [Vibrio cholerae]EGR4363246.1 hypothetical protein [Vibrio cholerae]GHX58104.1 hypothetical protein VCSRO109_3568 [Vibrio cholerae]GHZ08424.1 hypothetical protein VCSRO76_3482 [Vibrio cholerae]
MHEERLLTNKMLFVRGFDHSIYMMANEFYHLATSIPVSERYAAYIVNLSFSIELYIKSLDVSQLMVFTENDLFADSIEKIVNVRVSGHSLLSMFSKLPREIRAEMESEYDKQFGFNLVSDLESIKNAFVEYRYIFEKNSSSINLSAVEDIAEFLKNFIEQRYR